MRIIPKKTRVKIEFFKNVTLSDVLLGVLFVGIAILLLLSNFGARIPLLVAVLVIAVAMYLTFDGVRVHSLIGRAFVFFALRKRYREDGQKNENIRRIIPFTGIKDDLIDYGEYVAAVVEIQPKEFRLLSEYQQNQLIDNVFAGVMRAVSGQAKASIVKLERPFVLDKYSADELKKMDTLDRMMEAGALNEREGYSRRRIIDNRKRILDRLNTEDKVVRSFYYFVIYDANASAVKEVQNFALRTLSEGGVGARALNDRELAVFLKYHYTIDFDEREASLLTPEEYMEWIIPKRADFSLQRAVVDGETCYNYTIRDFPLSVINAWGFQLFNIKDTKVVMNIAPVAKEAAVRRIDRAIDELMSQGLNKFKTSDLINQDTHIQTLVELLAYLQNDNETLFDVTLHITIYDRKDVENVKDNVRKRIRRVVTEGGFKLTDNFGCQLQAFLSSSPSGFEGMHALTRSIHATSVAAVFPFVLNAVQDDKGVMLGQSNCFPVILDFFKRDHERVNSNIVVMGKSGSGKSFAVKTLLSNLAVENSKIFILDPENEYSAMTANLGGKLVDVGTAKEGRLNPFHIATSLDSDEAEDESATGNFSVHLQFLEEFFKQILPGIQSDPLEYLNNLIIKLYAQKNIDARTDLSVLTPQDYPIFDDLYALIEQEFETAKDDYTLKNGNILINYVKKFAGDGRNANLWNGCSSLEAQENFTVFNFQTLLANKNNTVANAQMLLVLKWLDNEIIKNRDFNLKHDTDRKIIVVIDEAHVFIDTKYPIALDFMFQLAKRIRKYNGMQIIITQNIKDFVGSEEIARKSTAIINACQYSFLFALAPNDMDDLCTLYEKAGQINETEQEEIINNSRGHAFLITSPHSRFNVEIIAPPLVQRMFEKVELI